MSRDFFFLDISAMRDKEGVARFYIASYTLAEEPAGEVWINNGNLRNQAFPEGTTLQIYVNDELRSQSLCKQGRFATVFQENLGRLKKGDAIRVAIGPREKSPRGGGRLFFTIEEYPAGEKPAAPIPILTPPLDAVIPQLGADGKIKASYEAKHQAQCKALLANNPELVFIGDSHTVRWPAELLQEKFGAFRPVNLGIGGDRVLNVLWRLQNGVLDKIHPKVIVLLIGTNNITIGLTPDQIAEGIVALIKAIQEKAPASKILLLGILPRGESIQEANNEKIRQTNTKLALLADNKRIFYLDVGDKLVEPDGSISREIMPDKLHVAEPGYTRWMDAMKPTLDKLLNE
jgi:lysophospholipase L1-like esterase